MAVLHTWGQKLDLHPHVHCIVPGGGLSPDGTRWISSRPGFFLPVRILSRVFRGKFLHLLHGAYASQKLKISSEHHGIEGIIDLAAQSEWVVHAKPPFGGPQRVLKYLARYACKIAISHRRLISMDQSRVTFEWKDYADNGRGKQMTLPGEEFLRRFLLHAVPSGFTRIRNFGLLANRGRRRNLALCRRLLSAPTGQAQPTDAHREREPLASQKDGDSGAHACPNCEAGHLRITEIVSREACMLRHMLACVGGYDSS